MGQTADRRTSVSVVAYGCPEVAMDATLLEQYFQQKSGFTLCQDHSQADLIIFLGCSVTQNSEDYSSRTIEILKAQKRPDAQLLVAGCIAKMRPDLAGDQSNFYGLVKEIEALRRFDGEALRLSANVLHARTRPMYDYKQRLARLRERLGSRNSHSGAVPSKVSLLLTVGAVPAIKRCRDLVIDKLNVFKNKVFPIKISTGCAGNCSYCSIRLTRGRIRSKPIDFVVREFESGLEQGYRYFALLGTDIGDYGKDRGIDLLDLLQELTSHEGDFKLRLRNVNPRWLVASADAFCELLKKKKIIYLESPAQSGSNRILQRMNRGYRIEDYVEALRKVRKACPSIFIRSQIMVGFPGETDEDFRDTLKLVDCNVFDYAQLFEYTVRPGTKAATLSDRVPEKIIRQRYDKLLFKCFFQHPLNALMPQYL